MQKWIAAAVVAACTLPVAAPAMARDFFNPQTLLGWRQQTGAAAVAYFRAPIGPSIFKAPIRTGFALTGPGSYNAGEVQRYSQAPKLVDFSFTKRGVDARWIAQFTVGNHVAWTNAPKQAAAAPGKVNLMNAPQLDAGNIAAGLAAGTVTFAEKDAASQTSSAP
jgi:hypothetical protein